MPGDMGKISLPLKPSTMGRRTLVKGAALSALVFSVNGVEMALSPREARAQGVKLAVLTAAEQETLEAIGDVLVPGAKEEGFALYLDHQLAADYGDCLLFARVMDIPHPIADFYRGIVAGIESASQKMHGKRFAQLSADQKNAFVKTMSAGNPDGWQGPPAPFIFFILRNDATDVYYGTVEGFERLGMPYMPHILPETKW